MRQLQPQEEENLKAFLQSLPAETLQTGNKTAGSALLPAKKLPVKWRKSITEYPAGQQIFFHQGRQLLFTAAGKDVFVLDAASGEEVLTWQEDSDVTAIHAVPNLNLLFIGRFDCKVKGYTLEGKLRWEFQSEMHPDVAKTGKAYWYRSYPGLGGIRAISDGPFDNNKHKLFIGSASTVEILNLDGTLDKRIRQWWGPCSQFTLARRRNGENIMLVGRRHNGFHHLGILESSNPRFDCKGFWDLKNPEHFVLGWIGVVRGHNFFEDLEGNGDPVVISDLTGVDNRIAIWDADGKPLRDVPLFGANDAPMRSTDKPASNPMPVRDMCIGSLNGASVKNIYCVTEDSLLLEFSPKLELKRCTQLPVEPLLLELFPEAKRMVTAGRNGEVLLLNNSGKSLAAETVNGTPLWISKAGDSVIISTECEISVLQVNP